MRLRRTLPALLMATGLALGLAACGDDDESEEPSGSDESMMTDESMAEDESMDEDMMSENLDFTGTTVDGAEFDGHSLEGAPAVLWFTAAGCPVCEAQSPAVNDAFDQYGSEMAFVAVYGPVTVSGTPEEHIEKTETGDLTNLVEGDDIWTMFEVTEQSYFVLIDAHGEVAETGNWGAEDLTGHLESLAMM